MFSTHLKTNFKFSITFILSSATPFKLDQSKILSFGIELKGLEHREYVYSFAVYQKHLTRLGELIIFEPWPENYHFSQPS